MWTEQIDTLTRSILALTVGCARCHDHKFDPIPTADYYALAGIFTSTDDAVGVRSKMGGAGLDYYEPKMPVQLASFVPPYPKKRPGNSSLDRRGKKGMGGHPRQSRRLSPGTGRKPRQQAYRVKWQSLQAKLLDLTDPGARGYAIHGLRESQHIGDTAIRVRGEAERRGPTVPRGFPTAFAVPDTPKIDAANSGRLELAQWLTNPRNPLASRVMVNRIWQHLFGQGIVSTMDNFGVTGGSPSHPELLDYLATHFVEDGWSVKKLVRRLVLSRTYRLGEDAPAAWREIDPENRLLWRHAPRRLDTEEIRDSMLAAAGRLQFDPPAGAPAKELKMIELRDNGPLAAAIREAANRSEARSIYLPLLRGIPPDVLAAFDPVTQSLVTGQRETTTVPVQALFLLNSAFVRSQSLALAEKLLAESEVTDTQRIRQAHALVLGRAPAPAEIERARRFLGNYEKAFQPPPRSEAGHQTETSADPDPDADDMDRTEYAPAEPSIQPNGPRTAAWMAMVQALFASAEFRFVR